MCRETYVWRQPLPILAFRSCRNFRRFRLTTPIKKEKSNEGREAAKSAASAFATGPRRGRGGPPGGLPGRRLVDCLTRLSPPAAAACPVGGFGLAPEPPRPACAAGGPAGGFRIDTGEKSKTTPFLLTPLAFDLISNFGLRPREGASREVAGAGRLAGGRPGAKAPIWPPSGAN